MNGCASVVVAVLWLIAAVLAYPAPRAGLEPDPSPSGSNGTRPWTTATPRTGTPPGPTSTGRASWYCNADPRRGRLSRCRVGYPDGPGSDLYAAAGPTLRKLLGPGWKGRTVTVSYAGASVRVRLVDSCGAGCTVLIDLYADAFERLTSLSRGIISRAEVSW